MRLWSIHPKYLDQKGLCGLWREALQAQRVLLQGAIKGHKTILNKNKELEVVPIKTPYYNHPQLERFKIENSKEYLIWYLRDIYLEAKERNYNFNINLINGNLRDITGLNKLTVTKGQLGYEFDHLQTKLFKRDRDKFRANEINTLIKDKKLWKRKLNKGELKFHKIEPYPLFQIIEGDIEQWEKIK